MEQGNAVRNISFILIALVAIGALGYVTLAGWSEVSPQEPSLVATSTETTTTTTTVTTPTPTPTPKSVTPTPTPAPTATWTWNSLGCGSQSPCTYSVCSSDAPELCYTCKGKYDSTAGEKLPTPGENPQKTPDFICVQKN